jgi:hypothetical protein
MTNGSDPVYLSKPEVYYMRQPEDKDCDIRYGLTKREYFAAMCLQGLIGLGIGGWDIPICQSAVNMADALLEALNREEKK